MFINVEAPKWENDGRSKVDIIKIMYLIQIINYIFQIIHNFNTIPGISLVKRWQNI